MIWLILLVASAQFITVTCQQGLSSDLTWKKVFSHDTAGGLFTYNDVLSKNPTNTSALLYSILGSIQDYQYDGHFHLRLCYPNLKSGPGCNEWKQTSNPVNESTITGYKAISIDFPHLVGSTFKGLGINIPQFREDAYIDSTPTNWNWNYAVGAFRFWPAENSWTIPGPYLPDLPDHSGAVTKMYLEVQYPELRYSFTENGETLEQTMDLSGEGFRLSVPTHRNGMFQETNLFIASSISGKNNMAIKIGSETVIMDEWYKPEEIYGEIENDSEEIVEYYLLKKQKQLSPSEINKLDNATKSFLNSSTVTRVKRMNVTKEEFMDLQLDLFNSSNSGGGNRKRRDTQSQNCAKWMSEVVNDGCWRWKNPVTDKKQHVHNIVKIYSDLKEIHCCYNQDRTETEDEEDIKKCCKNEYPQLCICTDERLRNINTDISSAVQCGVLCPVGSTEKKNCYKIGTTGTTADSIEKCQKDCEKEIDNGGKCCGFAYKPENRTICWLYEKCDFESNEDFLGQYTVCTLD